jgi:SAM-dependent methyltransferase
MSFKDHFSALAGGYAAYRPDYPDALFQFLAEAAPARHCAWDCATGSGQAAAGLAALFERVVATDASAEQIAKARTHSRVHYAVAPAEASGLPEHSVDLITVAQALHWFDLPRFHDEVRRVLRPAGLLAVWTYNLFRTDEPAIDAVIDHLYGDTLDAHWPAERRIVERGYADLVFPFEALATPDFEMQTRWDLAHLLGYLRTWSAVRRYREACGSDPVEHISPALSAAFGKREHVTIRWPLAVRVFRV